MVRKIKVLFFLGWVLGLPVLLLGSLGFVLGSIPGLKLGLLLGILAELCVLILKESLLAQLLGAQKIEESLGVPSAGVFSAQGEAVGSLRLFVISDVNSRIYLIRSPFARSGSVFLTVGLMTLLNGEELEGVLRKSSKRLSQSGMSARSVLRMIYLLIEAITAQDEKKLTSKQVESGYKLILLVKLCIFFPFKYFLGQILEEDDLVFLVQKEDSLRAVQSKLARTKVIWKQA